MSTYHSSFHPARDQGIQLHQELTRVWGGWSTLIIEKSDIWPMAPSGSGTKKKRTTYDHAFKLKVVRAALERPQNNRIKPTCAWFPGIEPCQAQHGALEPQPATPRPNSLPYPKCVIVITGSAPPIARSSPRHKKPSRDGLSRKPFPSRSCESGSATSRQKHGPAHQRTPLTPRTCRPLRRPRHRRNPSRCGCRRRRTSRT